MSESNQDQDDMQAQLKAGKVADWKRTLTGALDEQRLFGALATLGIFYVGYIIANASYNNNNNDEDDIIYNCTCKPTHRRFYIGWSVVCYILWISWHLLMFFHNEFPPTVSLRKKYCKCETKKSFSPSGNIGSKNYRGFKSFITSFCCLHNPTKLFRYESYLWTQYYELYVIGITKNEENFKLDKVQNYMIGAFMSGPDHSDGPDLPRSRSTHHDDTVPLTNEDELAKASNTAASNEIAMNVGYSKCEPIYVMQLVIHVILSIIRLLAQATIVPLLMIQMFDTYAFLCFASDNYCNMRAEYRLHLDQTAVTFGFYCSLMISLLTTTMLRWIPCPKKVDNGTLTPVKMNTAADVLY